MNYNGSKILNMLENERKGGRCTSEEYNILKERIILHAKNNTIEWEKLLGKIQKQLQNSYLPLGWLTKTLKHQLKPYLEPGKRLSGKNIHRAESVSQTPHQKQYSFEKKNTKNKSHPQSQEKFIHKTNYDRPVKAEKGSDYPKATPQKVVEKEQIDTYFFPFPDPQGFFWDDKKTSYDLPSSAYILKITGKSKSIGEYSLLTNKDKIVKNSIINQKSFLKPVCNIVEDNGSQNIIVKNSGLLEKKQDKWFPVEGKILQIKII